MAIPLGIFSLLLFTHGTSPTLPLPILVLDFQGVMLYWQWLDQIATSTSPASRAVVINQLLRQHIPEVEDYSRGVRMVEDESICDRYIHEKLCYILIKFATFHPKMVVSSQLISQVNTTHELIVYVAGSWAGH